MARRILFIPILRYVDDFFSAEAQDSVAHAMQVFARLVRVCLGTDAVAPKKLMFGSPLTVLGIDVSLSDSGGHLVRRSFCKCAVVYFCRCALLAFC